MRPDVPDEVYQSPGGFPEVRLCQTLWVLVGGCAGHAGVTIPQDVKFVHAQLPTGTPQFLHPHVPELGAHVLGIYVRVDDFSLFAARCRYQDRPESLPSLNDPPDIPPVPIHSSSGCACTAISVDLFRPCFRKLLYVIIYPVCRTPHPSLPCGIAPNHPGNYGSGLRRPGVVGLEVWHQKFIGVVDVLGDNADLAHHRHIVGIAGPAWHNMQMKCSAIPAPAAAPRFIPTLKPSGGNAWDKTASQVAVRSKSSARCGAVSSVSEATCACGTIMRCPLL